MKFANLEISKAKIHGLSDNVYYEKEHLFYCWDITLDDHLSGFLNLSQIYMGKDYKEAALLKKEIEGRFKSIDIEDNSEVITLSEKGELIAIGKSGNDSWIDINNHFRLKPFKELNIVPISIKVF